ncbi:hypothetical protein DSL72_006189 [Monilinia vaccinii-corymbosi]|uniref:F-box domain-containing protein n=1 Tax=Monilinia vaccinii-corymbosi TaxID=61207 RepID=A0A8A3PHS8_9HELO|nr:hypothetical protein DSL72_006189 [Monilinia vaccinii-corymbosi]
MEFMKKVVEKLREKGKEEKGKEEKGKKDVRKEEKEKKKKKKKAPLFICLALKGNSWAITFEDSNLPPDWTHRPIALSSSKLAVLPASILKEILSYLPAASAGAFSLSCVQIFRMLGDGYMNNILQQKAKRLAFIPLWARDIPPRRLCFGLYRKPIFKYSSDTYCSLLYNQPPPWHPSAMLLHDSIHNPHVQYDLSMLSTSGIDKSYELGFIHQWQGDARMLAEFFVLRLQDVYLNTRPTEEYKITFGTCLHLRVQANSSSIHTFRVSSALGNDWGTIDVVIAEENVPKSCRFFKCSDPDCAYEYEIQFERHVEKGVLISFTRFVNVGRTAGGSTTVGRKLWNRFFYSDMYINGPDNAPRHEIAIGSKVERKQRLDRLFVINGKKLISSRRNRHVLFQAQEQMLKETEGSLEAGIKGRG